MAQPLPSSADRLAVVIADLMALEERMRLGRPSQSAHDDHEEEATRNCAAIRAIFRGTPPRPVNPPLGRVGSALVW